MEWTKENLDLLQTMINLKPKIFQAKAKEEIRKKTEEICLQEKTEVITSMHIAKANYLCTPREFRFFVSNDLKKMGFDPAAF